MGKTKKRGRGRTPSPLRRPATREELHRWVLEHTGLNLPPHAVCEGHDTPLDYLAYVFFEEGLTSDTVVWACRGGGKTTLGAVATLLDMLFKPGIQIKILGGSREQALRMYHALCDLALRDFAGAVAGKVMTRGFALQNGSRVEILAQSQRSVRGTRVQKMRCDELELFDPEVWSAAQLTTRSLLLDEGDPRLPLAGGGRMLARGAVEVFSTHHRPGGLMAQLVARTQRPPGELPATLVQTGAPRRVFRWCIWDVAARCPPEVRACAGCELRPDCGGRARHAAGFVPVEDVLQLKQRVSRNQWETEMLCRSPAPENAVFPAFGPLHVRPFPGMTGEATVDGRTLRGEQVIAGIDYGWKRFVCLWIALFRDASLRPAAWIFDEYVQDERDLQGHMEALRARAAGTASGSACAPAVYYADVAGRQHDAHTGTTSEAQLKSAGFPVKSRAMPLLEGIHRISQLLDPPETWGKTRVPRLWVDPRCTHLVAALTHYAQKDGVPIKDGTHDHLIDALRYALAGHLGMAKHVAVRSY
jgi:hypothetical protein